MMGFIRCIAVLVLAALALPAFGQGVGQLEIGGVLSNYTSARAPGKTNNWMFSGSGSVPTSSLSSYQDYLNISGGSDVNGAYDIRCVYDKTQCIGWMNFDESAHILKAIGFWSRITSVGINPPIDEATYDSSSASRLPVIDFGGAFAHVGCGVSCVYNASGAQGYLADTESIGIDSLRVSINQNTVTAGSCTASPCSFTTVSPLPSGVATGYIVYDSSSPGSINPGTAGNSAVITKTGASTFTIPANSITGSVAANDQLVIIPPGGAATAAYYAVGEANGPTFTGQAATWGTYTECRGSGSGSSLVNSVCYGVESDAENTAATVTLYPTAQLVGSGAGTSTLTFGNVGPGNVVVGMGVASALFPARFTAGTVVTSVGQGSVVVTPGVPNGQTVAIGEQIVFSMSVPTSTTSAAGSKTLTFTSVPAFVTQGMLVIDGNQLPSGATPGAIPIGTTVTQVGATTVTISQGVTATFTVGSGDIIWFVPQPTQVDPNNVFGATAGPVLFDYWGSLVGSKAPSLIPASGGQGNASAFIVGGASGIGNVSGQFLKGLVFPNGMVATLGGHIEGINFPSNMEIDWYDSAGTWKITSGTYNNGTGKVILTVPNIGSSFGVGETIVVTNLTGSGTNPVFPINNSTATPTYTTVATTSGTTVSFIAATGICPSDCAITGGTLTAGVSRLTNNGTSFVLTGNAPSLSIPSTGALVTEIVTGGFVASANLVLASNACVSGLPYTVSGGSCGGGAGTSDQVQIWTGGGGQEATFTTDGSSHPRIGFGTETNPKNAFVVSQNSTTGSSIQTGLLFLLLSQDGQSANMSNIANTNSGAFLAAYNLETNCGTLGTPASCPASQEIGRLSYAVYHTAATAGFGNVSRISAWTSSTYNGSTGTDRSGFLQFTAVNTGSTSLTQAMQVGPGGVTIGAATTDPGPGNLTVGSTTAPGNTSNYNYVNIGGASGGGGTVLFSANNTNYGAVQGDANGLRLYSGSGAGTEYVRLLAATTTVAVNTTAVITTGDTLAVHGQVTTDNLLFLSGLGVSHAGDAALCIGTGTANTANKVSLDTSGTICGISAARFKTILGDLDLRSALDGVDSLSTPFWRYRPGYQDDGRAIHVGLIADEVERMDPRCGVYEDGSLVNYSDRCVTAHLVASIKELKAEVDDLKRRLH